MEPYFVTPQTIIIHENRSDILNTFGLMQV